MNKTISERIKEKEKIFIELLKIEPNLELSAYNACILIFRLIAEAFKGFEEKAEPKEDLGCILSGTDSRCMTLNIVCSGSLGERTMCPNWSLGKAKFEPVPEEFKIGDEVWIPAQVFRIGRNEYCQVEIDFVRGSVIEYPTKISFDVLKSKLIRKRRIGDGTDEKIKNNRSGDSAKQARV